MAVFSYQKKQKFEDQCQLKDFTRFLLRIVQQIHSILNNPDLFCVSSEEWNFSQSRTNSKTQNGSRCLTNGVSDSHSHALQVVEKADVGFLFWQTLRHCRELVLKALVLINVVDKPKFVFTMNYALERLSKILDTREMLRKLGLQFASIQWPPLGRGETPFPPYAVDIAMEVLLGGGRYPRLPILLEEVVKQVNENEVAVALSLDDKDRCLLERRIEVEVSTMWALSKCKKNQASFSYTNGIVSFTVFHEFSLQAIYDLQRFQIVDAEILVGASTYGLDIPRILNIGFRNFLCQALALIDAKYQLNVEQLKNRFRQLWISLGTKDLPCVESESRQRITKKVLENLENCLCSMFWNEDNLLKESFQDGVVGNLQFIQPKTSTEETLQETKQRDGLESFRFNGLCSNRDSNIFSDTSKDYFFECLRIGRLVTGSIILAVLRDQALRARNFSSVFPGCIFCCREIGRKDFGGLNSDEGFSLKNNAIKALDLCIVPCFDSSCGGLLSPLLALLFDCPSLECAVDPHEDIRSMLSHEDSFGPSLIVCSTDTTSEVRQWGLVGTGAILRIGFEMLTGSWKLILWPISPLIWLLESLGQIERQDLSTNKIEKLQDKIKTAIPVDLAFVFTSIKNDSSWTFIQSFNANHLEVSAWTQHAAGCLTTLILATLGGYIKNSRLISVYTPDVELCNDVVSLIKGMKKNSRRLKWIYFKKYLVTLLIDPFEGTLRISFGFLGKENAPWLVIAGNPLDAHLAAAVANGGSGVSGLIHLFGYLKYMAFLHLCRETFALYNWEESNEFLLFIKAFSKVKEPSHTSRKLFTEPQSLGSNWIYKRSPSNQDKPRCNVTVATPPNSPQLTLFLHMLKQEFEIDECGNLRRSLVLIYRRLTNVVLCLRVETVATLGFESCQLFVLRLLPSVEVVTQFLLDVPYVRLLGAHHVDLEALNLTVKKYVEQIDRALETLEVPITHAITLAQFPPEIFPVYFSTIQLDSHPVPRLFFLCIPYGEYGEFFQRDLGWCVTYFSNFFTVPRLKFHVQYIKGNSVQLILNTRNGARLPLFRDEQLKNSALLSITPDCSVRLESIQFLPNKSFWAEQLTMYVRESTDGTLSSTYLSLATHLSLLSFFLKGCRELQRLEILRQDILVLRTTPCVLEALWVPWSLHSPFYDEIFTGKQHSCNVFELTPVRFLWSSHREAVQDSRSEVAIAKKGVFFCISSLLLQPVLKNSTSFLEELLEKQHIVSPWTVMRYIIYCFELHASISLVVSHNNSEMYRELGVDVPQKEGLLLPGHLCWSRKDSGMLGTEELVLDLEELVRKFPGLLPRIIDKIELSLCLTFNDTAVEDFVDHIRRPFCVAFTLRIKPKPGFESSGGFILESLNETLSLFAGGFSALTQDTTDVSSRMPSLASIIRLSDLDTKKNQAYETARSNSDLSTQTHHAYIVPTRLLIQFLIPLLDGIVLWLNAITAACAIKPRGNSVRSGVLYFLNNKPNTSTSEEGNHMCSLSKDQRNVLCLGSVQWTQALAYSFPVTQNNVNATEGSFSGLSYPNGSSVPSNIAAHTSFPFERFHADPYIRNHLLEITLVPTQGAVLELPVPSTYNYVAHGARFAELESLHDSNQFFPHSTDLFNGFYFCHWKIVREFYRRCNTEHPNILRRVCYPKWHCWPRELNVNLLPIPGLNLIHQATWKTIQDSFTFFPPFSVYSKSLLQYCHQRYVLHESSFELKDSLSDLNKTIFLSYWDMCPDALLLPYESDAIRFNESKQIMEECFPIPRKRMKCDIPFLAIKKRLLEAGEQDAQVTEACCRGEISTLCDNKSLNGEEKISLHHTNVVKESTFQQESSSGDLPTQSNVFKEGDESLEETVRKLCEFHSCILSFGESTCWIPPVKPHTAFRADKSEVELFYHCSLEMRTSPSATEWSVVSKYSRMLSHELLWGDFALFVSLFQKNFSNAMMSDLASLLDLATCNIELYMDGVKRVAQYHAASASNHITPTDVLSMLSLPFFQFVFNSPPELRQGSPITLLHFGVIVWKCLPFFSTYLQFLFQSSRIKDNQFQAYPSHDIHLVSSSLFHFSITVPLGVDSPHDITIGQHFSLENLQERLSRLSSHHQQHRPQSFMSPHLSLHRSLSLRLARLFFSSISYNILESAFQSLNTGYSDRNLTSQASHF